VDAPVRKQIHNIGRRRAWVIWLVALAVYVLSVFHRSSLGVAGLMASDRFGISASQLALFTVLQLLVYAGMQVPVGVLLDRFGSRRLLLSGLALLTVGQLAFAFAESFPAAIAARVLVGLGDATIFISVMRLIALWFLVRQAPLVTQMTGQVGQLGAILAAAPLSLALHSLGWTRAFSVAAAVGLLLMVAVVLIVKDSPYRSAGPARIKIGALGRELRGVWGSPGTKLGMWSHFTAQFSITVFSLLWGYPFLVSGQGLSPELASGLLMLAVASSLTSGRSWPGRSAASRSTGLGSCSASSAPWASCGRWCWRGRGPPRYRCWWSSSSSPPPAVPPRWSASTWRARSPRPSPWAGRTAW
jgi:MFS family permease